MRREKGNLRKVGKIEGTVSVANCMTLGTRVHLEVLKPIAKRCSSSAEEMLVHGFTSRPVVPVKQRSNWAQLLLTLLRYG